MNPSSPRASRSASLAARFLALALSIGASFVCVSDSAAGSLASPDAGDWPAYGRDSGGNRFSPLAAIDRSNVASLRPVWTYETGDLARNGPSKWVFECTPLAVEGKIFVVTPLNRAVALDAATGREIWSYDTGLDASRGWGQLACRGAAYWKGRDAADGSRLLVPRLDGRIYSLDAGTGEPDPGFGRGGFIDLLELLAMPPSELRITSPPTVIRDLAVIGFSISDGPTPAPHAPVVAADVRTGEIVWRFNTVPQAGEFGEATWANGSNVGRGGANVWTTMSADPARGVVYLPVSSPKFDFHGGDRPGDGLFGNCVVALEAATGRRLWHFQTVRHDLWDYDLPAQPNLVDLTIDGRTVPAVAQIGKTGFVYLLNRVTGEPIFPIKDRPVPASDVPGESASPTQPFPTKPPAFTTQSFGEENVSDMGDGGREAILERLATLRNEGIFTPPSERGSIVFPGFHGGGNWSGSAFDPGTGRLYVNSTELVCIQKLVATPGAAFPYRHAGYERFRDPAGWPANAPPWGQLTAIDLNRGEIAWQVPLGEFEELAARGIPITGQENFGGPAVTAGGLVFVASTMDGKFRAFDSETGRTLFEAKLPAAGFAAPAVCLDGEGRQRIVVCCGGGGKLNAPEGDAVVAFGLGE